MLIPALVDAIFASTFTLGQAALIYTEPIFLIGLRMSIAGILILAYVYAFNKASFKSIGVRLTVLITLFHIYIPYITEFWGLKYVGSAKAALLYSITPFVTAFLEWAFFDFKFSAKKIIGMVVGILGLVPILLNNTPVEQTSTHVLTFISLPELAVLVSALSSCFGWLLIKHSVVQKKQSILMVNGKGMLFAGILALLTSPIVETWNPVPSTNIPLTLLYTSLLILVGNFLYYNFYGLLLKKYSATFLSFFGFTIPIFAAIYQWIFFKQPVGWGFVCTSLLTIIGLFIFYQDELRREHVI